MKMFPARFWDPWLDPILEETLINDCSLPDLNRQPGKGVDFKSTVFTNFTKRAWIRMMCALTGSKGVPLEGPFLGHFSQGILGEMNENTHFSVFRIF